jgi:hypothetical protein
MFVSCRSLVKFANRLREALREHFKHLPARAVPVNHSLINAASTSMPVPIWPLRGQESYGLHGSLKLASPS